MAFIGNDVGILANKFDCLGIAEPDQCNAAQDPAIKGQLDQLGFLVGHGKQALTQWIEGQCRDIILKPFDDLALHYGAVVSQVDCIRIGGVPHLADLEPGPFKQAKMLRGKAGGQQGHQRYTESKNGSAVDTAHGSNSKQIRPMKYHGCLN